MDISTGANKTINKHNIGLGNCPKIGFRAALAAVDIARFIHFHYLMGHIMVYGPMKMLACQASQRTLSIRDLVVG